MLATLIAVRVSFGQHSQLRLSATLENNSRCREFFYPALAATSVCESGFRGLPKIMPSVTLFLSCRETP
jgi:hypothetical protein